MSVLMSACISYHLMVHLAVAQNSTSSDTPNVAQGAAITVGVLAACFIIAVVVAKLVDYCYDRHMAISDNSSDISEDTRNLIRLRLAANAFKKKKPLTDKNVSPKENQRKIIRLWSARAKESRRIAEQRRAEDAAKKLASKKDIIKVEEASGDAKFQPGMASVPTMFLTVSENPSPMPAKSAQGQRAGAKTQTSVRSDPTASPVLTPRGAVKSPVSLVKPDVKKMVSGLDTKNGKAAAGSVNKMTSSGNLAIALGKDKDSGPDSSREVVMLDMDLDGEDTFRSALVLGQDTVRSELSPDHIALSCRSNVSPSPTPILQGLQTLNAQLSESVKTQELHDSGSTEPEKLPTERILEPPELSETGNTMMLPTEEKTDEDMDEMTVTQIRTGREVFVEHSYRQPEDSPERCRMGEAKYSSPGQIFTVALPNNSPHPSTAHQTSQSATDSGRQLSAGRRQTSPLKVHRKISPRPHSFRAKDLSRCGEKHLNSCRDRRDRKTVQRGRRKQANM